MKYGSWLIGGVWILMFLTGCSSTKETVSQQAQKNIPSDGQGKDRSKAMQLFIDGSLKESKGQFADAILDYQEAIRYDQDPAIYFALAKNFAQLQRFTPAAENALEAVKRDSLNIDFRQLLAQIYIQSGQFDKAAFQYYHILEIDSLQTNSLFALAQILQRSNPQQSLQLYQRILTSKGPSWDVLLQVAQLNSMLQRYDDAAKAFEEMEKIDPSNIALKQNLTDLYLKTKQFDKAKQIIGDVLEQNPENPLLRATLADVYLQQNDWQNAKKELEKVLQSDSLDPDLEFRIGIAYYSQTLKDSTVTDEAIGVFKKYETMYPNDWRPYLYLGVLYRTIKQDSVAESYLNKATQTANWNADAWWQLGWLYFDKQDFRETVDIMNKAKQYVPDDFRIFMLLGISYNRMQMNDDARVALERAVELNPNDVNALSSLGLTYDALKLHNESDSTYERALRLDPANALVLNNYAYSFSERGIQLDRALAMSRQALDKDSTNSSYLDTYGWILYQLQRYDEALIYIQRAISAGDASAVVLEHLGDVYARLNRTDEAKQYWTKALEKDQTNSALREKIERGRL
jgi:tetratricopeptide (TPR) repeat protein